MDRVPLQKMINDALLRISKKHKNLVVLSADYVETLGLDQFAVTYKERHFSFGLAEENMVSAAPGFVVRGKNPILVGLSSSLMKSWQQIRNMICYSNLNVKILGAYAGLTAGEDGAGYQSLEDLALMRVLPNMKIVCPADYFEAINAVEKSLMEYGPVYVRLPKTDLPVLFDPGYDFRFGQSKVVCEGEEICVFATGTMVEKCIKAADLLKQEGKSVKVVNVSSIKPLDERMILKAAKDAKLCATVEDHSVVGGLGSAISELFSREDPKKLLCLGVDDVYGESGSVEELYRKHNLDVEGICKRLKYN